ncbi:hypothetical protein ACFQU9_00555 [Actinomadura namibiensis]|uniref:Cytoskeletal protein RodZ n=1 Tax=Actinomadura namibiensis TaxID=182080 RepID=A0A7W3LNE0_ACTNM|nr:hypothetical protein [Actinomadura namibiensis]MBA8951304.1 cytoskeletal protein RodZ [Actinomadura namibiensis]
MQLPRVVIAAVFFVIGALIAIPALMRTTGESRASGAPGATTTSPTGSPTGTSPTPTSTRTSPSPTPTRTTTTPPRTTPPPATTAPPASPPAQTVEATIGRVRCPARTVEVTIRNNGSQTENVGIERNDDSPAIARTVAPGASRVVTLRLRENRSTRVQVTWKNEPVLTETRRADCVKGSPTPSPTRTRLPRTGPDDAVMWARAATGGAAMITGLIIFWYGGIWPRRRDRLFAGRKGD